MNALGLIAACFMCAVIPACLFLVNFWLFREPVAATSRAETRVDVLIPARDEARNIREVLESVLANEGVAVNVVVYDDHSADETAMLVEQIASADERVRLLQAIHLPEGWNGKQHACWRLAEASNAPLLLFLDADVRLKPDAIARCIAERERTRVPLLSGFPRIVMVTSMEWLLLPVIHFVLLGLLPMFRMRQTARPAYAAGCGQFMLAERNAYFECGGHAAIRQTRHDGLKLPHLFRERGLRTDICDLTRLAHVRMYRTAAEVWNGLAKNSTEGLGSPGRIVPITVLLFFGQVGPTLLLLSFLLLWLLVGAMKWVLGMQVTYHRTASLWEIMFWLSLIASLLPAFVAAWRFKQPLRSALFHPLGVLLVLVLQWYALVRQIAGKPVGWRARSYSSATGEEVGRPVR